MTLHRVAISLYRGISALSLSLISLYLSLSSISLPPPPPSPALVRGFTLYSLAVQQLSKQDHYDFGLRALTSLLRYAGKKRRVCPDVADEEILLMSMKDMNIAKLASVDLPLFNGIIQDLFPAVETPTIDYGKLRETIEAELRQACLQVTPFTVTKVIQLYETKNSRHSTMIVGKTGSGKTVTWRTLQSTLTTMHRKGEPGFNLVRGPQGASLATLTPPLKPAAPIRRSHRSKRPPRLNARFQAGSTAQCKKRQRRERES
ncbi:unnamed protein product [Coregonus sp. 'balchen']|nr:unnamed protein product [Coregonus sp. 'balchen']